MKILVDVSLSPLWVAFLAANLECSEIAYWGEIGNPRAPDAEIFAFARANGHAILTHDLDFGALLVEAGGRSPSVIRSGLGIIFPARLASRSARRSDNAPNRWRPVQSSCSTGAANGSSRFR